LAAPAETPLQHHPDHSRCRCRRCPRTRHLIKMGRAPCADGWPAR
jgi:hypothetical protein